MSALESDAHLGAGARYSTWSEASLLAATRAGDPQAFAELWNRVRGSVQSYARHMAGGPGFDAEDLVSEAITATLSAIRSGAGPTPGHTKGYLIRAVQTAAFQLYQRRTTVVNSDVVSGALAEEMDLGDGLSVEERILLRRAFTALPQRWQDVLWLTVVQGVPVPELAGRLGVTAQAVLAMQARATEGLRQRYLLAHSRIDAGPECERFYTQLGAFARGRIVSRRTRARIDRHVAGCDQCSRVLAEICELDQALASVMPAGLVAVLPTILAGTTLGVGVATGSAGGARGQTSRQSASAGLAAACLAVLLGVGTAQGLAASRAAGEVAAHPGVNSAGQPGSVAGASGGQHPGAGSTATGAASSASAALGQPSAAASTPAAPQDAAATLPGTTGTSTSQASGTASAATPKPQRTAPPAANRAPTVAPVTQPATHPGAAAAAPAPSRTAPQPTTAPAVAPSRTPPALPTPTGSPTPTAGPHPFAPAGTPAPTPTTGTSSDPTATPEPTSNPTATPGPTGTPGPTVSPGVSLELNLSVAQDPDTGVWWATVTGIPQDATLMVFDAGNGAVNYDASAGGTMSVQTGVTYAGQRVRALVVVDGRVVARTSSLAQ